MGLYAMSIFGEGTFCLEPNEENFKLEKVCIA
jgi:hypothetical protein